VASWRAVRSSGFEAVAIAKRQRAGHPEPGPLTYREPRASYRSEGTGSSFGKRRGGWLGPYAPRLIVVDDPHVGRAPRSLSGSHSTPDELLDPSGSRGGTTNPVERSGFLVAELEQDVEADLVHGVTLSANPKPGLPISTCSASPCAGAREALVRVGYVYGFRQPARPATRPRKTVRGLLRLLLRHRSVLAWLCRAVCYQSSSLGGLYRTSSEEASQVLSRLVICEVQVPHNAL